MSYGILDPNGTNKNPITNRNYSNDYKKSEKWWFKLPVYQDANKVVKLIEDNQVILVIAGTGSGKSTLFKQFSNLYVEKKQKESIGMDLYICRKIFIVLC